jgi:lysozyme family protein
LSIETIIDNIITAEGEYSNDPLDAGGATKYGITFRVARSNGYMGDMKDLPLSTAKQIYKNIYWLEPHFDRVATLSPSVAEELCDTGVNCGVGFAEGILQSCLNLLNREQADYKDIPEDKAIGPATLNALASYLIKRGKDAFLFGWFLNRVKIKGE